jgi:NADH-quinone oxidoreductase subunit G
MPRLSIDGHEIEVAKGVKVIEAAERLGIIIPRFCYHPALGSVGACRVCAVMIAEGPVQGVQMSCLLEAVDGMVVLTGHPEAVAFRRQVIEWLMMNHPHDCPVCDEGGHCLLQDMTVAGGHGLRRYLGRKRTYRDQHLGTFVQHEMNRCIHCYRCWRFYQGFAGYRDLGCLQIAHRTYFGRFSDGPLESPFSGNLIDLCPTGVYTDRPTRFNGRRWDFERGPSLCLHCALGCNTVTGARYREIVRQEARFNKAINGFFICDRGRYGFFYESAPERPRHPRIGEEASSWGEALQMAADTLARIYQNKGPGSISCLGSSRSSLEAQGMLKWFCQVQGWENPRYFETRTRARNIQRAVSSLDERVAISMREIEEADFILAIGADPVNEAPMLALAMRQAFRNQGGVAPIFPLPVPPILPKGNSIAVLDPRPVSLPLEFIHLPIPPADFALVLSMLMKRTVSHSVAERFGPEARQWFDSLPTEYPFDEPLTGLLSGMEQALKECRKPVIVCGTDIVGESTIGLAADFALLLKAAKGWAGLFYLMPAANSYGAALLSSSDRSLVDILEGVEKGTVKALVVVENDPFWSFPDQERLKQALEKLDLLLVLDYLPSPVVGRAHIFFPTNPLFETRASFVNQEGRVQFVEPVHTDGIPIAQTGGGSHPPRHYGVGVPGGEPKPAWLVLAELAEALAHAGKKEGLAVGGPESLENLWGWMAQENPAFAKVPTPYGRAELLDGLRLIPETKQKEEFSPVLYGNGSPKPERQQQGEPPEDPSFELLLVDWTFGTEELAGYSRFIREVEKSPCLFMQAKDVARLGLKDKDKIRISREEGSLEVELAVVQNMAPGIMVLPRHRQLNWRIFKELPVRIPVGSIQKA